MPYKDKARQLQHKRADYFKHKERRRAKVKAYKAEHYRANRELYVSRALRSRLRKEYGLTPEDYDAMLKRQNGHCALCPTEPLPTRRLAIDHDHKTGEIRGLLCTRCNTGLERIEDVPGWAKRATEWIKGIMP